MNPMGYNLPFKRKWARMLVQWYKSLLSKHEDPSTYIKCQVAKHMSVTQAWGGCHHNTGIPQQDHNGCGAVKDAEMVSGDNICFIASEQLLI